jgi:hypothetical protein
VVYLKAKEVKELLKIYNDIPQMIAEEFATIRNCENEKNKITLPTVNLSGMPGGKGVPGDRTANTALTNQSKYYEEEINSCYLHISELRQKRDWVRAALNTLDRTARQILQLAYIVPEDPFKRRGWRAPTWGEVAQKMNYSKDWTCSLATRALFQLAHLSQIRNKSFSSVI